MSRDRIAAVGRVDSMRGIDVRHMGREKVI
jgi:hypothetical protein